MRNVIYEKRKDFTLDIPIFLKNLEEILEKREDSVPERLYLYDVPYYQAIDCIKVNLLEHITDAIAQSLKEVEK